MEGLLLGADDYIVKPFSIDELDLKIKIFLKRSRRGVDTQPQVAEQYTIGSFEFDFSNLLLRGQDAESRLTYREAEILRLLIQNMGKLISREEIMVRIWGENDYFSGRSLDVFISRLRKHLSSDTRIRIENRHGIGYILLEKTEEDLSMN
jgi:DNA-binding response OmpR family regulator